MYTLWGFIVISVFLVIDHVQFARVHPEVDTIVRLFANTELTHTHTHTLHHICVNYDHVILLFRKEQPCYNLYILVCIFYILAARKIYDCFAIYLCTYVYVVLKLLRVFIVSGNTQLISLAVIIIIIYTRVLMYSSMGVLEFVIIFTRIITTRQTYVSCLLDYFLFVHKSDGQNQLFRRSRVEQFKSRIVRNIILYHDVE